MNSYSKLTCLSAFVVFALAACDNGPKVIPSSNNADKENSTGIFSNESAPHQHAEHNHDMENELHTVVAEEVLPTTKYVYLKVKEGETHYWIATGKMEVKVGETYFYQDGLLKTNFVSKEYNRTFDEMYLVSKLVPANHANHANVTNDAETPTQLPATTNKISAHKDAIKIAELVKDPKKYSGKTILISGKCVKVNANIMGRNWLHFQDGSKDDYDLVISSSVNIPEGHIVNMTGKVVLNKDFGAGYRYDIILEEGQLVK